MVPIRFLTVRMNLFVGKAVSRSFADSEFLHNFWDKKRKNGAFLEMRCNPLTILISGLIKKFVQKLSRSSVEWQRNAASTDQRVYSVHDDRFPFGKCCLRRLLSGMPVALPLLSKSRSTVVFNWDCFVDFCFGQNL